MDVVGSVVLEPGVDNIVAEAEGPLFAETVVAGQVTQEGQALQSAPELEVERYPRLPGDLNLGRRALVANRDVAEVLNRA